ncbi:MAG TPA: DUF234 domain-containing protein [Thermoanaerobaculia bacterium]
MDYRFRPWSFKLVEHRQAVGPRRSSPSWGSWHLADSYIRFWGRWILPYTSQIEFGETEQLIREVLRPGWDRFVGSVWEELARRHVLELAASRTLPFWPEEIGSWWSGDAQIDVVAVQSSRRCALVGEARWRREKMGVADLDALKANARTWLGKERGWELWYALFSRSGFSAELTALGKDDPNVLLVDPTQVVGAR